MGLGMGHDASLLQLTTRGSGHNSNFAIKDSGHDDYRIDSSGTACELTRLFDVWSNKMDWSVHDLPTPVTYAPCFLGRILV